MKKFNNYYNLSDYATQDKQAFRLREDETFKDDLRSPFALDRDRILYSGAYRRYQGKTQVIPFSNLIDEELTNRNIHTTYVSQVARSIGLVLGLNLDLIEAIAIGHDLGHTPFGHVGEMYLSEISVKHGIGHFLHNIQSLRVIDYISNKGNGLNLTFQVRDGIISHNGERNDMILNPHYNKTEDDLKDYIKKATAGQDVDTIPSTLEGCVVRFSDTIAYIGQDIEDAMRHGLMNREDLPYITRDTLGKNSSQIVHTLINSVVKSSLNKDYITMEDHVFRALVETKEFNNKMIYKHEKVNDFNDIIKFSMNFLFETYLNDLNNFNYDTTIYKQFKNSKAQHYIDNTPNNEMIARDFISTMTDRFFNEQIKNYTLPLKS